MTDQSKQEMKGACHDMIGLIMRKRCRTNRCKWLQAQLVEMLRSQDHINWYAEQYDKEYPYADAPNEYFAEMLKEYDREAS